MDHGDCHGVRKYLEYLFDDDIVGGAYRVPAHAQEHYLGGLTDECLFTHPLSFKLLSFL